MTDWITETRRMIEEARAARRARWHAAEKASRGETYTETNKPNSALRDAPVDAPQGERESSDGR
jgi:hypothetical protein